MFLKLALRFVHGLIFTQQQESGGETKWGRLDWSGVKVRGVVRLREVCEGEERACEPHYEPRCLGISYKSHVWYSF